MQNKQSTMSSLDVVQIIKDNKTYYNFYLKFAIDGKTFDLPMILNTKFIDKKVLAKILYKLSKCFSDDNKKK